ncbi:MAG: hypothetical protein AAF721_27820 [Myxococcota bacterium]
MKSSVFVLAAVFATGCPGSDDDGGAEGNGDGGTATSAGTTDGGDTGMTAGASSGGAEGSGTAGPTDTGAATTSATGDSGDSGDSGDTAGSGDTAADSTSGGMTTGDTDGGDEALCADTNGTWDDTACGHYECGVPNPCEALIPGCDCGAGANFVEGMGCMDDLKCSAEFDCGDALQCSIASEYCQSLTPGQKGGAIMYSCNDIPEACDDDVSCDCLEMQLVLPGGAGSCSGSGDVGLSVDLFAP